MKKLLCTLLLLIVSAHSFAEGLTRIFDHPFFRWSRSGLTHIEGSTRSYESPAWENYLALALGVALMARRAWLYRISRYKERGRVKAFDMLALLIFAGAGLAIGSYVSYSPSGFLRALLPASLAIGCIICLAFACTIAEEFIRDIPGMALGAVTAWIVIVTVLSGSVIVPLLYIVGCTIPMVIVFYRRKKETEDKVLPIGKFKEME